MLNYAVLRCALWSALRTGSSASAPRSGEKMRCAPRSGGKMRCAPCSGEKLRCAPRSGGKCGPVFCPAHQRKVVLCGVPRAAEKNEVLCSVLCPAQRKKLWSRVVVCPAQRRKIWSCALCRKFGPVFCPAQRRKLWCLGSMQSEPGGTGRLELINFTYLLNYLIN